MGLPASACVSGVRTQEEGNSAYQHLGRSTLQSAPVPLPPREPHMHPLAGHLQQQQQQHGDGRPRPCCSAWVERQPARHPSVCRLLLPRRRSSANTLGKGRANPVELFVRSSLHHVPASLHSQICCCSTSKPWPARPPAVRRNCHQGRHWLKGTGRGQCVTTLPATAHPFHRPASITQAGRSIQ